MKKIFLLTTLVASLTLSPMGFAMYLPSIWDNDGNEQRNERILGKRSADAISADHHDDEHFVIPDSDRDNNDRPFACTFSGCVQRFTQKSHLTAHERTHTDERPYACTVPGCDKRFAQQGNLTRHLRIHTGEKPYVCTFESCSYRCADQGNLTVHIRIHTGDRPYACPFDGCGKQFIQQIDLTRHTRTHTGEQPYACTFEGCSQRFTRQGTLTAHVRTQHAVHAEANTNAASVLMSLASKATLPSQEQHDQNHDISVIIGNDDDN